MSIHVGDSAAFENERLLFMMSPSTLVLFCFSNAGQEENGFRCGFGEPHMPVQERQGNSGHSEAGWLCHQPACLGAGLVCCCAILGKSLTSPLKPQSLYQEK